GPGSRVARPLPTRDRGPFAPGAFSLAQDPGAVRFRLSAQPGSPPGARAGRAQLCGALAECDRAGPAWSWKDPSLDWTWHQSSGSRLRGVVLDPGELDDPPAESAARKSAGAQFAAVGLSQSLDRR